MSNRLPFRLTLVSLVMAVTAASSAAAAVPTVMNYQGRLTDSTVQQNPVSGTLPMTFRIYGSIVGPDLLWQEIWPSVEVTRGIFNVLLGSHGAPLPASIFASGTTRFLEVEVSGEVLTPRQLLGSVGFAFQADRAMLADTLGAICAEDQVFQFVGGQWICADLGICLPESSVTCYAGPSGTAGVGVCRAGTAACNGGGTGYLACQGQVLPSPETCGNGVDDDCNGFAEEVCACPVPGEVNCGGLCVNHVISTEHCGSCNNACAPGSHCQGGSCTVSTIYAGTVSNPSDPTQPGPGIPSLFTFDGLNGVPAADAMCQAIGGDHFCSYEEVLLADSAGEMRGLTTGTSFWVHRLSTTVTVGGVQSPPGAGGRCVDWTYPTGHISDAEFGIAAGGALQFHFDQDTTFTGRVSDGHAGTGPNDGGPCGGVTRRIVCCK